MERIKPKKNKKLYHVKIRDTITHWSHAHKCCTSLHRQRISRITFVGTLDFKNMCGSLLFWMVWNYFEFSYVEISTFFVDPCLDTSDVQTYHYGKLHVNVCIFSVTFFSSKTLNHEEWFSFFCADDELLVAIDCVPHYMEHGSRTYLEVLSSEFRFVSFIFFTGKLCSKLFIRFRHILYVYVRVYGLFFFLS